MIHSAYHAWRTLPDDQRFPLLATVSGRLDFLISATGLDEQVIARHFASRVDVHGELVSRKAGGYRVDGEAIGRLRTREQQRYYNEAPLTALERYFTAPNGYLTRVLSLQLQAWLALPEAERCPVIGPRRRTLSLGERFIHVRDASALSHRRIAALIADGWDVGYGKVKVAPGEWDYAVSPATLNDIAQRVKVSAVDTSGAVLWSLERFFLTPPGYFHDADPRRTGEISRHSAPADPAGAASRFEFVAARLGDFDPRELADLKARINELLEGRAEGRGDDGAEASHDQGEGP